MLVTGVSKWGQTASLSDVGSNCYESTDGSCGTSDIRQGAPYPGGPLLHQKRAWPRPCHMRGETAGPCSRRTCTCRPHARPVTVRCLPSHPPLVSELDCCWTLVSTAMGLVAAASGGGIQRKPTSRRPRPDCSTVQHADAIRQVPQQLRGRLPSWSRAQAEGLHGFRGVWARLRCGSGSSVFGVRAAACVSGGSVLRVSTR